MDNDVIKILENQKLFNWYFDNRNYVLLLGVLLSIVVSAYMSRRILRVGEKIDYKEIYGKTLAHTAIALIIGTGLNAAGMEFKFAVNHMPILLFSGAVLLTAGIQIIECTRYSKNYIEVIKRANIIFIGIIECVVLLLAVMGRLEVIELVAAVIGYITLKTANDFIDSCVKVPLKYDANIELLTEDYPVSQMEDLFESRKRQLDNLCKELEQSREEPFAVAISGEWGSGKTSFVNVLKEKLSQAEFVNVECSIEYDVKAALKDLSSQIQEIFKRNNVYIGTNGVIDKYFKKIGEFVDDAGYSGMAKIIDKIQIGENSSYLETKAAMNKELKIFYGLTGKRIYFVVDDMDRIIDDEMRAMLFQVIRESVSLSNCITLFMVDYDRLTSERMSKEFLEKYVNHQFELCDTEFEEVVEKYEKLYFTESFWLEKSDYIKERGKASQRDIKNNGSKFLLGIQNKIKEIKESQKREKISDEDRRINEEHLDYLQDAEMRLQSRMKNPRKVKRYLDSIKRMLNVADIIWFQNEDAGSNEYSQENWVETILEVAFLKAFLYEEYDELIKAGSLYFFKRDKKNSYIVEFIISGFCAWLVGFGNKENVVEMVVYRLYALDINTDKTEHQILMEELDKNTLQEENLLLYVNECLGINFHYERMQKILNYLERYTFENPRYKAEVVVGIMSIISGNYNMYVQGLNKIMERIKSIVDDSRRTGIFNEREWNMIEHYTNILQTRLIFGNSSIICSVLGIVHNTEFTEYFDKNMDTVSQLHDTILKINEVYPLSEFTQAGTEIQTLINYFQKTEEILSGVEFRYAENEIKYFLKKVMIMLEILDIWFGKEEPDSEQYYNIMHGEFKSYALENADNLINSLKELESYFSIHQEDVKVADAFIELVRKLEILDKENPDYFGKDKNKVIIALSNTYELLGKNPVILKAYEDNWRFCKLRLFRLRRNMKM